MMPMGMGVSYKGISLNNILLNSTSLARVSLGSYEPVNATVDFQAKILKQSNSLMNEVRVSDD